MPNSPVPNRLNVADPRLEDESVIVILATSTIPRRLAVIRSLTLLDEFKTTTLTTGFPGCGALMP